MAGDADQAARKAAIERLKAKRAFKGHLVVYVLVNLVLVGIWALSGAGFFWPVFAIGGWGIAIVLQAWSVYGEGRPMTEADIEREMRRGQTT